MTLKSPRSGIPPIIRKPPIAVELDKLREKPARATNREPLDRLERLAILHLGSGEAEIEAVSNLEKLLPNGDVGLLFVRMPHKSGAYGRTEQWAHQLPIDQRWSLPRSQRRFPARHCIQLWPGLEGYSWLEPHIRTLPDLPGSGVATDTTPAIHIIRSETQEPANTCPIRQSGHTYSICRQ